MASSSASTAAATRPRKPRSPSRAWRRCCSSRASTCRKARSLQLKNVAAVMVTTALPAFAQPGQLLDVTVSSMGNAKSLRGGTLLMTPLKGADGQVYGMAQGNVLVGGVGAQAAGSSRRHQSLERGTHLGRRHRRAQRAFGAGRQQHDPPGIERHRFRHRQPRGRRHQQPLRRRHGRRARWPRDPGAVAGRQRPARGLPGPAGKHRSQSGPPGGQGHHECAHRLGGDEPVRDPGNVRHFARQPVRHHQCRAAGEPAGPLVGRTHGGHAERRRSISRRSRARSCWSRAAPRCPTWSRP